jgi:DNA polymerase-1
MVREAPELSYDTETSGLDWRRNSVVGYVIGAPQDDGAIGSNSVVYIPIRHGGGGNIPGGKPLEAADAPTTPHPFEMELAAAFRYRGARGGYRPTIGHNTLFDVEMSANHGVMLGRQLVCTQNNQALLDEYQRSFSLDSCAKVHGVQAKLGDDLYTHLASQFGVKVGRSAMSEFWRTSGIDEVATSYARGDGVTTFQLYQSQMEEIESQNLTTVWQLESDLIWTLFRMKRKGIRIDIPYLDELQAYIEEQNKVALKALPDDFNVRSPVQMRALMEKHGHTNWPTTEKGAPSFTEKWLKKSEIGRLIVQIRKYSHLINTFVGPLRDTHSWEGRVHANLNQLKADDTGTISGRLSCTDPNLQGVPKRDKDLAIRFRKAFIADEGHLFWERDYSQCEPRLFGHYSGDPNLIAGYNEKPFVDAHSKVAELLGVERDPTAKRMNMGIFTGMQTRSFAEHMGWELPRATEAFNKWFEAFPGVKTFQQRAQQTLRERGYVRTLLGRRCRLESPRFAYRGTSKIIQGSNADIVKYMLLKADRMCEDAGDIVQILMTVHDSFNGQRQDTPEANALFLEMEHEMKRVQEPPFNLRVPFEMDGYEGANWAEATFGKTV